MRTLELREICGYLPHGLRIKLPDNRIESCEGIVSTEFQYDKGRSCITIGLGKPILRPLSDLYKPITHDGEEIIPIMELAKMACPYLNWVFNDKFNLPYNGLEDCYFEYKHNTFLLRYFVGGLIHNVNNQLHLFDYLYELKIDLRGLIEADLAIDCNTLENNPYK
jgi:hypothetical protein